MRAKLLSLKKELENSLSVIDEILSEKKLTIEDIVCGYFDITIEQLHSKSQRRDIVTSRQIIMWYDITENNKSLKAAGSRFKKDHATALSARNVINNLATTDSNFADTLHSIITDTKKL